MSENPDHGTLSIRAAATREVEADVADARVMVSGQSYIFGNEALTKATEVRAFVASLRSAGIDEAAVSVEGVEIDLSSGLIAKGSRAAYRLRVECRPVSRLASVLGCVAGQKTMQLNGITWRYPNSATLRDELLQECLADARRRANVVADGLGVPLLGVARYEEQFRPPEGNDVSILADVGMADKARRRSAAPLDLGSAFAHRGRFTMSVEVTFLVGRLQPAPNAASWAGA